MTLTGSQRLLLALIRSALQNDNADLVFSSVDWKETYSLAKSQGVQGIVFDTLEKLPSSLYPPKTILLDWMANVTTMERTYNAYVNAIMKLSDIIKAEDLTMLVMKGYGCSLNYPFPSHRPCGDIDIFVMTCDGTHSANMVRLVNNVVTKEANARLVGNSKHHSVIQFGKFAVENHESILDIDTHKSSIVLNKLLETLAADSLLASPTKGGLLLPSVKFNSIHLLRHMANDFATVKTSLRHVLDWSTFVSKNKIDWDFVYGVAHQTNMYKFLNAINSICIDYLGYNTKLFRIEERNEKLRDRVLQDILSLQGQDEIPEMKHKLRYGIAKTHRMWRNRWKYAIVYDECLLSSFLSSAYNRILHLS